MRKINRIIWHCSATPEGRHVSTSTIKAWHKGRGWSDIGYHYVIELDGRVYEGRPIAKQGAHVKGHNKDSIGICYVGGLDSSGKVAKDTRTSAQKATLYTLTAQLLREHPGATVHGHNEYDNKACPSFNAGADWKAHVESSSVFHCPGCCQCKGEK